LLLLYLLFLIN